MIARHVQGAAQAAFHCAALRALRAQRLTRRALASRLGITRQTLCGYLTREAQTPLHVVLGVSIELGLPAAEYVPELARLAPNGGRRDA